MYKQVVIFSLPFILASLFYVLTLVKASFIINNDVYVQKVNYRFGYVVPLMFSFFILKMKGGKKKYTQITSKISKHSLAQLVLNIFHQNFFSNPLMKTYLCKQVSSLKFFRRHLIYREVQVSIMVNHRHFKMFVLHTFLLIESSCPQDQ